MESVWKCVQIQNCGGVRVSRAAILDSEFVFAKKRLRLVVVRFIPLFILFGTVAVCLPWCGYPKGCVATERYDSSKATQSKTQQYSNYELRMKEEKYV